MVNKLALSLIIGLMVSVALVFIIATKQTLTQTMQQPTPPKPQEIKPIETEPQTPNNDRLIITTRGGIMHCNDEWCFDYTTGQLGFVMP